MDIYLFFVESRKWDSNPRPTHYECVALPTEPFRQVTLATHSVYREKVGKSSKKEDIKIKIKLRKQ